MGTMNNAPVFFTHFVNELMHYAGLKAYHKMPEDQGIAGMK